MRIWTDFITKENLETETGEVDMEKVRVLSLNTYLQYIEDFIELGGNEFPAVAADQVEEFMVSDFICYTHAMEGRYPEPKEITEHLRKPENVEARQYWIYICVHANKDNWPDFIRFFREELNVPEDVTLKNEEQINQLIEKTIKERTWKIKEL